MFARPGCPAITDVIRALRRFVTTEQFVARTARPVHASVVSLTFAAASRPIAAVAVVLATMGTELITEAMLRALVVVVAAVVLTVNGLARFAVEPVLPRVASPVSVPRESRCFASRFVAMARVFAVVAGGFVMIPGTAVLLASCLIVDVLIAELDLLNVE